MGLIKQFRAPASLRDFERVPGLSAQWSDNVSDWFDSAIDQITTEFRKQHVRRAQPQFFNPLSHRPKGPVLTQPVLWGAFPKELVRKYGFKEALVRADRMSQLSSFTHDTRHRGFRCRPGSEYCEWRVTRDSRSRKIKKIIFTSEPPEYWRALFGGSIPFDKGRTSHFRSNRRVVLKLYRRLVSDKVELADLLARKDIPGGDSFPSIKAGDYNPFNKWNTTHGIVHLTHPSNSLLAEIGLAAAATVMRKDSSNRLLVEPEELICCAGYGNPNRNSDPTIGATVNALARMGAKVTLHDPVGVYMDRIDLAGWTAPNQEDVSNFVRITRGCPGMITRLEIEVPPDRGFNVGDLKIGGVPISYGGQVADCITVKLVGVAGKLRSIRNPSLNCDTRCFVTKRAPLELVAQKRPPRGGLAVFIREGELELITHTSPRRELSSEHCPKVSRCCPG